MAFPRLRGWTGFAPAAVFSALSVCAWGYFVWTGTVTTVWPLLGVANQLLAAIALAIATSWMVNHGRARYTWATLVPLAFMCANTLVAGWLNLSLNYLRAPLAAGAPDLWSAFAAAPTPARIQCVVTLVVMALMVVIVGDCARHWWSHARGEAQPSGALDAGAAR